MRIRTSSTATLLLAMMLATMATASDEPTIDELIAIQAFLGAAQRGDLEFVERELDAGRPIDTTLPPKDPRYPYTVRTALESAAVYANVDVVAMLLERGASLRRDERYGLYAASLHSGDSPALLALLRRHAGPDSDLDADFGPALIRAAANGAVGEVATLLSIGVDPDYRGRFEPSNIPAIVRAGLHLEVIDLLVDAGADPTGGELPYAWSPLFPAAMAADATRIRRFLEMGIDPHLRGERGNALSLVACRWPRTVRPGQEAMRPAHEVVALLLEAGVDPNVESDGRTPLRCAEDSRDVALGALLETAGARSHESLWYVIKRGVGSAVLAAAILLGGGM